MWRIPLRLRGHQEWPGFLHDLTNHCTYGVQSALKQIMSNVLILGFSGAIFFVLPSGNRCRNTSSTPFSVPPQLTLSFPYCIYLKPLPHGGREFFNCCYHRGVIYFYRSVFLNITKSFLGDIWYSAAVSRDPIIH